VPPSFPLQLDVNGFFTGLVGERGFGPGDVDEMATEVGRVVADLEARREAGGLPFYDLPYDDAALKRVGCVADELHDGFDTLVVLGIGGSALGTKAVLDALPPGGRLAVHVLDNIDPSTISDLLGCLDLRRTAVNVISKSGQTAETMAQLLVVRERLMDAVGSARWADHVVATTDPVSGTLRAIAADEGFRTLDVPAGVGGRFSVLSAVGLLPIAAAGHDVRLLCEGARAMDARTRVIDVWRNPAALHATLLHLAQRRRSANIHVLMPYCDGLLRMAEWYAQLWAESLGKRRALDGRVVETGQTPVRALGATDQHSQVQLYVEGPHDKVVTFVRVERHRADIDIPAGYDGVDGVGYLSGHSLGALLNMEQRATELALAEAGRLTSLLTVESVDAHALGQLFHLFEVQTLVGGGLAGVDPLDQPGVEAGKRLTYAMAGRAGYEDLAGDVRRRLALKSKDFVLDR
jgi:glucose-6-phosphate isomerase